MSDICHLLRHCFAVLVICSLWCYGKLIASVIRLCFSRSWFCFGVPCTPNGHRLLPPFKWTGELMFSMQHLIWCEYSLIQESCMFLPKVLSFSWFIDSKVKPKSVLCFFLSKEFYETLQRIYLWRICWEENMSWMSKCKAIKIVLKDYYCITVMRLVRFMTQCTCTLSD